MINKNYMKKQMLDKLHALNIDYKDKLCSLPNRNCKRILIKKYIQQNKRK